MRRAGFSVTQIMALSGNYHLPESTVKNHVKGVTASSDAPAQKAVEFLTKALDESVTFQSIHSFLEVKIVADDNKVSINDIVGLVRTLNGLHIPLNDFVNDYKRMRDAELTPLNLKTFLGYKDRLEVKGFGLNHLGLIDEASKKLGGPEQVLTAISKYSDLKELQKAVKETADQKKAASDELENTHRESTKLKNERSELNTQINSAKVLLNRIKRVQDLGYTELLLKNLVDLTKTAGGISQTLTALRKLIKKHELDNTLLDLQNQKKKLELEKTTAQEANAHLNAHIAATRKLIEDHKLGLDAIAALLRIAKKYGSAPDVLKAFENYDSVNELKKEQSSLRTQIDNANANLKELTAQEKVLRDSVAKVIPEIESNVKRWIKSLDDKLNETTTTVESTLKTQSQKFNEAFTEYLSNMKGLKEGLDDDFKKIKDTSEGQVKILTDLMKSGVEDSSKDFTKTFAEARTSILKQISSILEAAHEIDKAYAERKAEPEKVRAFLELLTMAEDPTKITDIRFLATLETLLEKTKEWVTLNASRFHQYYPGPSDIRTTIDSLLTLLRKVDFEPRATT